MFMVTVAENDPAGEGTANQCRGSKSFKEQKGDLGMAGDIPQQGWLYQVTLWGTTDPPTGPTLWAACRSYTSVCQGCAAAVLLP